MESYDSITNQMLLMEKYEQRFNIQDTIDPFPISLVTMSKYTDVVTDSLMERSYTKLLDLKLPELTGLSITELLDMPTYKLKAVIRALRNSNTIKNNTLTDKEMKELKKSLK